MPLRDVVNFLTASEAAARDTKDLGQSSAPSASTVRTRGRGARRGQQLSCQTSNAACSSCGWTGHSSADPQCPARIKECSACGRQGHFQVVCRSRGQGQQQGGSGRGRGKGRGGAAAAAAPNIAGSTITGDDVYILQCYTSMRNENLIWRNFMISDGEHFYPMKFMVDTRANVTVISKRSYYAWFDHLPLKRFPGRMLAVNSHALQL